MYGKTSFRDRAPLADTMAVFCLPFRRCWSGRQALVAVLLIAVYVTLMVHQPADPPIVTRPAVWPLFADISAGRSVAAGRTTAGRPADFVSPAADQVPVMTQRASQQPLRSAGYPVDQNADQKVDQKVDQASDQVDSTRGNNNSEGLSNGGGDGARGGDGSRTSGGDSAGDGDSVGDSDGDSVGDSDGSSDSLSDRDTRCAADRAADDSAGLPCAESERHGPAQRVISYSLFQADGGQPQNGQGDQDGWGWLLKGLDANAELSVHLYPGWRIRVYHDTIPGTSRRNRLAAAACRHRHIDLCYVRQQDRDSRGVYRGALWRFFPLSDPLVDAFVSRDLDSRLSQREVTAVHHWLATNRTFHIMRDHWEHLITVPGGLWGARPSLRRPLADKLGRQLDKWLAHPGHKNWDQRALHSVVWFHAAVDSVQHDSYTCQRFPGYTVPFPSRRAENDTTLYLGQVVRPGQQQHAEKLLKCPPVCRPANHPDWEYC